MYRSLGKVRRRTLIVFVVFSIVFYLLGLVSGVYLTVISSAPSSFVSSYIYFERSPPQVVINGVWIEPGVVEDQHGFYVLANVSNIGNQVVDAVVVMRDDLTKEVRGNVTRNLEPGEYRVVELGFIPFDKIEFELDIVNATALTVKPSELTVYAYPAGFIGYLSTYFMINSIDIDIDVVSEVSISLRPLVVEPELCRFASVIVRFNSDVVMGQGDIIVGVGLVNDRGILAMRSFTVSRDAVEDGFFIADLSIDEPVRCGDPISVLVFISGISI